MPRAVVVHVPVHRAFARAEELHAIHADVSVAGLGVFRVNAGEGDVAPGAAFGDLRARIGIEDLPAAEISIQRPALNNRQPCQVGSVPFEHHLLANSASHGLGRITSHLDQIRQLLHFLHQRGRNFRLHQLLHALRQRIEIFCPQRLVDPPVTAKGVDRDGYVRPFDVFKQQRFSAEFTGVALVEFIVTVGSRRFAHSIGNFGDLQNRIDAQL